MDGSKYLCVTNFPFVDVDLAGKTGGAFVTAEMNDEQGIRSRLTESGKQPVYVWRFPADIVSQPKLLPPNCTLRLQFHRAQAERYLNIDGTNPKHLERGYHAEIVNLQCEILKVKLRPLTLRYIESTLANKAARYYMQRVE